MFRVNVVGESFENELGELPTNVGDSEGDGVFLDSTEWRRDKSIGASSLWDADMR